MHGHRYTLEEQEFMEDYVPGHSYREIQKAFTKKFGWEISIRQVNSYISNHHLNTGRTGRFQPGQEPPNKGKAWDEFMSRRGQEASQKTQFKKGQIPHNGGAPVGELRIRYGHKHKNENKYYWQKIAQPNVWRMKHIIEWEEHNGEVPQGCIVCFADGDTLNWHIENLILTTRAQNAVKNRWGIKGHDIESAETANLIADLKMATNKARRKNRRRKKRNGI